MGQSYLGLWEESPEGSLQLWDAKALRHSLGGAVFGVLAG